MPTLLLGPSRWSQGFQPAPASLPVLVDEVTRRQAQGPPLEPIEIRRQIVRDLREEGLESVIIEDLPSLEQETPTTKFHRILREADVDLIEIYWPAGANRAGLDVEIGFILSLLDRRELSAAEVHLELQSPCVEIRGNDLVFLESGRRTQYFLDLFQFECPILVGETYDELLENVLAGLT
jgi:hypothetical protein